MATTPDHPHQPDDAPSPRPLRLTTSDSGDSGNSGGATPSARELVLVKHGHRYVFRCEPGRESELLDRLVEMVQDPQCELDWFDAAVLSHQLGQRMHAQIQSLRRKSA